jgi:HD-GYP domain-containing protein (c-di-GMP phosphodiesterase class II)
MGLRWPSSRSLLYPLTAILVALAVVPVALLGWASVGSNREQVATIEMQYLTRQSVGLARELEMFFIDSTDRIETMAQALRLSQAEELQNERTSSLLADLVGSTHNISLLRLLDTSGRGPSVQHPNLSAATLQAVEPKLTEAFQASLRGQSVRQELVRLRNEDPVLVASFPVMGQGQTVVAVLQGVVSLTGIMTRLAEESGRGVIVDVVDHSGEVIFSSEVERMRRSAANNPLVSQFLAAPVRLTKTYRDPLRFSGGEVLGSLCPMERPAWAVVTARDVELAFAAVNSMARRTLVLGLVTGIIATLAGVLLARRITSPLRSLAEVTTAVAGGDFTRRVPVMSRNELGQLGENFNFMSTEIERFIKSLKEALRENEELLVDSIRALAAAIDAKNPYTRGHSERVSSYAVAVAKHYGLKGRELKRVEIAALLHDVGKIVIEDAVLLKPGALSDAEFAQMRSHTVKGAAIINPMKRLRDMLPGIRSHHEDWSGGGYPDGLKGEQIPLLARIIAAADVFDAMTTDRPYQKGMALDSAAERLRSMAGKRLDPAVVDAFFAAVRAHDLIPQNQVEVA